MGGGGVEHFDGKDGVNNGGPGKHASVDTSPLSEIDVLASLILSHDAPRLLCEVSLRASCSMGLGLQAGLQVSDKHRAEGTVISGVGCNHCNGCSSSRSSKAAARETTVVMLGSYLVDLGEADTKKNKLLPKLL